MPEAADHLGSGLLLGHLDGELSRRDAARVAAHLEACWSCRIRLAEIERTIAGVVSYRDHVAECVLPPQRGRRAQFVARLDERAAHRPAPSGLLSWPAWTVAAALLALVFFAWLSRVPTVSAAVVLQRAARSEAASIAGVPRPVIRQSVELRAGGRRFRRTIYRDPAGHRAASQWHSPADADLERAFRSAGVPWDNPLSAGAYEAWRSGYQPASERTARARLADGSEVIVLMTAAGAGAPVEEASLVVRVRDWHPVRRSFRLRSGAAAVDYECTELAFSVFPATELEPGVFAEAIPSAAPPPLPPSEPASVSPAPAAVAELAGPPLDLQIDTLYRLHLAGACLGEAIETIPEGAGLRVAGRVADDQRKAELLAALAGLPLAQVDIRTFDEAPEDGAGAATLLTIEGESNPSLSVLRAYFERSLPPREAAKAATDLSDDAVASSRDALRHAWPLRRLAERIAPDAGSPLSDRSRLELERMISDHRQELNRSLVRQAHLLAPLFLAFDVEDAGGAAWSPSGAEWRAGALALFAEIEIIDRLHWQLFAGGEATSRDLAAVSSELCVRLGALRRFFAGHGTELRLDQSHPR